MPHVLKGLPDDRKHGGTLSTTFLLAMASPIIALPVERIVKPSDGGEIVADDRALNPGLSEDVKKAFGPKSRFKDCPFFAQVDWRLICDVKPFNIAEWGNNEVFAQLASDAGKKEAAEVTTRFMMSHLRNAIAHGGVVYLDKDGRLNEQSAAMLGFVSAKIDYKTKKVEALHVSRLSEADFQKFLLTWCDWIANSGVGAAIDGNPALAA